MKKDEFIRKADLVINKAKDLGAQEVIFVISAAESQELNVRQQKIEELTRSLNEDCSIIVYKNQAKGAVSLNDCSEKALFKAVETAILNADLAEADPFLTLPKQNQYQKPEVAEEIKKTLDKKDSRGMLKTEELENLALTCEKAALDFSPEITNSEGASAFSQYVEALKVDSNGFKNYGEYTNYGLGCGVLASRNLDMQTGYFSRSALHFGDLGRTPQNIGETAAGRAIAALEPKPISSGNYPIIFRRNLAAGLLGSLFSALEGMTQFRKLGFLTGALGQKVMPEWLSIIERPFLPRKYQSSAYDANGLPPAEGFLIKEGVIEHYLLNLYSSLKLNMSPTGNAGGTKNARLEFAKNQVSFKELLSLEPKALYITELMGQGVNLLTGDYSRGAKGFLIENGKIIHPIDKITIAGNLKDMFNNIIAGADDYDDLANTQSPSLLIQNMVVAQ